jgi:hypothetical protein
MRLGREDQGIAMVTVIAVTAVLTMFVVAGVAFSIGTLNKSRNDQDWNGALAAAYAGVEDYQSKLSNDPSYVRFGNSASPFTTSPMSSVTPPDVANPAFGTGAAGTWAEVAGSDDTAHFRYEVNNSSYYTDGALTLRSTGRVGDVTRTIYADLKQSGFVDYVYFTDYETIDPFNTSSPCYAYAYEGRPSSCQNINFASGDEIDGPVHSNDRIVIECGATFRSPVTTAYNPAPPAIKYEKATAGSCTPNFAGGVAPTYAGQKPIPPTNSEMRKETRYDLPTEVPLPGCLYTGPTSIVFNSDGTMTVKSPWTKKTQVSATSGRDNFSYCGRPGTGTNQLGHVNGQRVTVPNNNLIFVQNVPSLTSDPNYSAPSATITLGTRSCSGTQNTNVVGYPISNEVAPAGAYVCRNGDVFVSGTLEGRVTVTAENNVYVVADVEYENVERDALGLVGQNAVIVWNPVRNRSNWKVEGGRQVYYGSCISGYCNSGREIHAAILSVQHTFMVQNTEVQSGDRGDLRVYGSIAQKFRGVVRWYSGYSKDYEYDKKFRYTAPPKFLTPASTTYGVSTWVEINPVFSSDGTYR